ncbi:glycosyltransferase family 8 protein [Stenomitos frigidus]|uniref:Glycosyltransferase family 8 protein n=1 Tax=Stenomitos frigidus ULC18 TaxID=2107698 RepID=A0A2T1E7V9_9CYAN|nr:glycosyltransferase family 8 protein [Stenomitos frigidus]PSB28775.1 glycosyltransferase family 8 protein [Stenomitos frigidus ULC18]
MQLNSLTLVTHPATVPDQQSQTLPAIDDPIVLVCSADENYAMPMTVMLTSVLANLKTNAQLMISVLDGGIHPLTKRKVVQSLQHPTIPVHVDWIKPDCTLLRDLPVNGRLTLAAYYRLLIPEALPTHLHKVIYLDCDMIVQGNVAQLWQLDVGEDYVLAVQDDYQPLLSSHGGCGLRNYRELGLNPDQKYFNSGLLVMNLKKWREDAIGSNVLEFSRQNWATIVNADQDGLNAVMQGRWGQISDRWNQLPGVYTYSSWEESPYDEAAFKALRDAPYIIHYTNLPKPWQHGCQHPATPLFLTYLDRTAWKGWRDTVWRRASRKVRKGIRKSRELLNPASLLV